MADLVDFSSLSSSTPSWLLSSAARRAAAASPPVSAASSVTSTTPSPSVSRPAKRDLPPARASCAARAIWRSCGAAEPVLSTSCENEEAGSDSRRCGSSNSARAPASKSITCDESMMVWRRCAIVRTVHSANICRIAVCSTASVSLSIEAVASSSASTEERRSVARARQSSWRWPTEKFAPPSDTLWSRPPSTARIASASCTSSSTRSSSSSSAVPKGSRLYRTVSLKSTGSCGMIASRERSCERLRREMSTPSIWIAPSPRPSAPPSASMRRQTVERKVDLPLPVRPTTPTFAFAGIAQLTPRSAGGSSGR
mmetsp:Transcript_40024/g.118752  ORF Transcript_40024/g.118752 Transcript_40024/m.118752 type:complete len:312 (+) Transcript_40024:249-1184(+)